MIINSLCGCLVAYGLAGLRLTVHSLLINLVVTALQSMISIQLQVTFCTLLTHARCLQRRCWTTRGAPVYRNHIDMYVSTLHLGPCARCACWLVVHTEQTQLKNQRTRAQHAGMV